jgi:hypothetical protein
MGHTGIVHKNVKGMAAPDLTKRVFHLLLIGDIAQMPFRGTARVANRRDSLFRPAFIDLQDVNRCPRLRERICDCASNAACPARNERGLSI